MIVSDEVLITQLGGHSDFLWHTLSSTYSFFFFWFLFLGRLCQYKFMFPLTRLEGSGGILNFVLGTSGYGYHLYYHEEPGRYRNNWILILSVRGNYYLHDAFCTYCSVSSGV